MKTILKIVIPFAVIAGLVAGGYQPALRYWKERNRPTYRTAKVSRERIVSVVNSTGTVNPVLRVQVGSFVSGPIEKLSVDFNDEVKAGDLLAKIDPRIYEANVARDKATLMSRRADVERVQADLQRATNDERRSQKLRAERAEFISDTEMDQYRFAKLALEAQLSVAKAAVEQAQATLELSEANLAYTEIRSPVDGMVIDRKIDPGQTLAAQFQTPELFVIAPDMRKEMHIFASVDEADIGLIREAQKSARPVVFTVDAYPDELFEGKIHQVRKSSSALQNVVTYPVIVSAANPDLKLLPGMTANITFQIEVKEDVLAVSNAAVRFYPQREQVRPEDHKILDGTETSAQEAESESTLPADELVTSSRERSRRHVWVVDGDFLRAIEVTTGLSDHRHTELVAGDVKEGQALVTGLDTK